MTESVSPYRRAWSVAWPAFIVIGALAMLWLVSTMLDLAYPGRGSPWSGGLTFIALFGVPLIAAWGVWSAFGWRRWAARLGVYIAAFALIVGGLMFYVLTHLPIL